MIKLCQRAKKRHIGGYIDRLLVLQQWLKTHPYLVESRELKLEIEHMSILLKRYLIFLYFLKTLRIIILETLRLNGHNLNSISVEISSKLLHWVCKIKGFCNFGAIDRICWKVFGIRCDFNSSESIKSVGLWWSVLLATQSVNVSRLMFWRMFLKANSNNTTYEYQWEQLTFFLYFSVELPTEKRVRRWGISLENLMTDPLGKKFSCIPCNEM